jgi:hypothetical protein
MGYIIHHLPQCRPKSAGYTVMAWHSPKRLESLTRGDHQGRSGARRSAYLHVSTLPHQADPSSISAGSQNTRASSRVTQTGDHCP